MLKQKSERKKRRRLKRWVRVALFVLFLLAIGSLLINIITVPKEQQTQQAQETKELQKEKQTQGDQAKQTQATSPKQPEPAEKRIDTTITISAAGDFTLGTDETFLYAGSFPDEAEKSGLSHFTAGLGNVFKEDDLSTVNLETTLTDATEKAAKKFRFKGDPEYADILTDAGIESVNLANNHIFDYLDEGYADTKKTLQAKKIGYFGYDDRYVTTIKGVKVGALGYEGWEDTAEIRSQVEKDIKALQADGAEIIVVHFHWGIERTYVPESSQQTLARFTIDAGADLVAGHHPHVVQGIEEYNGKFIVYSLGNFMFGGNRNPSDKDTFVFQQTFHIKNGEKTFEKDIKVIPFSISSRTDRNDYQPTRLTGAEKTRVMNKIIDVSGQINGTTDWTKYMNDSEPSQQ